MKFFSPFKKIRNKRRSVFFTIFLSYMMILILPLLIGMIIFPRMQNVLEQNANRANLGLLEQAKLVVEAQMEDIQGLAKQLTTHPKLNVILSQAQEEDSVAEQFKLIDFMKELRNYRNANGVKSEFYLYFPSKGIVLTPYMKANSDLFFKSIQVYQDESEGNLYQAMREQRVQTGFFPSTLIKKNYLVNNMLTYMEAVPIHRYSPVEGYIVVHFDEEHLHQMLTQMKWANQGAVYIVNSENELMLSNSDDFHIPDEVLNQLHEDRGYLTFAQDQTEMLLSYTLSESRWKYISVVPKKDVMQPVVDLRNIAINILIICFVVGMIIVFLLSYRNYIPIRDVVGFITNKKQQPGVVLNEYEYIKHSLQQSFAEEEQLKKTLKQHHPVIQSNFLSRLIKGYVDLGTVEQETIEYMGVKLERDLFQLLIIQVDDCTDFIKDDTEQEWALVRFIIYNLVDEMFEHSAHMIELDRHQVAVLVGLVAEEVKEKANKQMIQSLQSVLVQRFRMKITLTASQIHKTMTQIPVCYREAMTALDYRMILGNEQVIYYEKIKHLDQQSYYFPMEVETQLMNSVRSGQWYQTQKILNEIYIVNFEQHQITPKMSKCLFFDVAGTLLKLSNGFSEHYMELITSPDELLQQLMYCSTAEEMHQFIEHKYEQACNYVKDNQVDQQNELYKEMKQYIEDHYSDSNMSLVLMAEHFNITPQYLSSFFKKQEGLNVTEYIASVRMEHAKQYLIETDDTIAQVAEKVGYTNDNSFSRLFKKVEGITPGNYRKLHKP